MYFTCFCYKKRTTNSSKKEAMATDRGPFHCKLIIFIFMLQAFKAKAYSRNFQNQKSESISYLRPRKSRYDHEVEHRKNNAMLKTTI